MQASLCLCVGGCNCVLFIYCMGSRVGMWSGVFQRILETFLLSLSSSAELNATLDRCVEKERESVCCLGVREVGGRWGEGEYLPQDVCCSQFFSVITVDWN